MIDNLNIIDLLKDIGLTNYEAQVFLSIYKKSPQTATMLANDANVSRGRIYEVLRNLAIKGLVIEMPVKGTANLYALAPFPECLEELKNNKINDIEQNFITLINQLKSIERKENQDNLLPEDDFIVIKGEKACLYYLKKILTEAQESILTNFTANLLMKYKTLLLELKAKKIKRTFILNDNDLANKDIIPIIEGSDYYVLSIDTGPQPLIEVFKETRPTSIIVDDKISMTLFNKYSEDALIVRNPAMVQYIKFILGFFKKAAFMD